MVITQTNTPSWHPLVNRLHIEASLVAIICCGSTKSVGIVYVFQLAIFSTHKILKLYFQVALSWIAPGCPLIDKVDTGNRCFAIQNFQVGFTSISSMSVPASFPYIKFRCVIGKSELPGRTDGYVTTRFYKKSSAFIILFVGTTREIVTCPHFCSEFQKQIRGC